MLLLFTNCNFISLFRYFENEEKLFLERSIKIMNNYGIILKSIPYNLKNKIIKL